MIYFIQAPNSLVKIGYSGNVPQRLSQLRAEHGQITLLAVIPDAHDDGVFHAQFRDCWVSGEWFLPSPELTAFIASLPKSDGCSGHCQSRTANATVEPGTVGIREATTGRFTQVAESAEEIARHAELDRMFLDRQLGVVDYLLQSGYIDRPTAHQGANQVCEMTGAD